MHAWGDKHHTIGHVLRFVLRLRFNIPSFLKEESQTHNPHPIGIGSMEETLKIKQDKAAIDLANGVPSIQRALKINAIVIL